MSHQLHPLTIRSVHLKQRLREQALDRHSSVDKDYDDDYDDD